MNGYVCFYNGQRWETYADSQYAAIKQAREHWNVPKPKQHMVSAELAEKDGQPVVHTPS